MIHTLFQHKLKLLILTTIIAFGMCYWWWASRNTIRIPFRPENIEFRPDGGTFAVQGCGGISIWSWPERKETQVIDRELCPFDFAWSPDGQQIAAEKGKKIYIWQVDTGAEVSAWQGQGTGLRSIDWSSDGVTLAGAGNNGLIYLWDVTDGSLLHTLSGHRNSANTIAFSPNGQLLASGGNDGATRLWRVEDGQLLYTLSSPESFEFLYSVTFSPDGKILASAGGHGTVDLWRPADGTLLQTLTGYQDSINSIAFSPDGRLIAAGGGRLGESWDPARDTSVRVWDVQSGQLLHTFSELYPRIIGISPVTTVAFSRDGTTLVAGYVTNTIRFLSLEEIQASMSP